MEEQPAGLLRRFLGSIITAAIVGLTVFMALILTLSDGLTPQDVVLAIETRVNRTALELRPAFFGATPTTPTATASPEPTQSNIASASASASIRPPVCQPPAGWIPLTVARTDTLLRLAIRFNLGAVELMEANCLSSDALIPGSTLFVPAAPLPTRTPAPTAEAFACGPPGNWVQYQVKPGDNLFRISLDLGVSIAEILQANCRELNDITIAAGEQIFLPGIPVNSGPPSATTNTPTATPEATLTPLPSATSTPQPTASHTPTPPNTPTPPPPITATPSNTPVPPSPTATGTAVPPTPTHTPTSTTAPPTPTHTPTPTPTVSPTSSPTNTATPTPTNTVAPPTATPTPVPPTNTPTPTP
ncbi:MAG: LysM peptidoglycan-binding domain-containing protein [Anaerolineales bacterium]|nr:LysM peptidoglycan-binding domain-containing protein [Anaerolineales bacterium]